MCTVLCLCTRMNRSVVSFFSVMTNTASLLSLWRALEIIALCFVQVTESSTVQIVNNGKILKLFKASAEDTGRYSCKAINIAGTSQKDFSVNVLGKEKPPFKINLYITCISYVCQNNEI